VPSELENLNVQIARQRSDLERRSLFYSRKAGQLMRLVSDARNHPEGLSFRMPPPGEILLLVATGPEGNLVWASSQTAGVAEAVCGETRVQEVTTTIVIPRTLSSAVAFDLDDNLAGLVVGCGDRSIVVTPETYRVVTADNAVGSSLAECCSLEVSGSLDVVTVGNESELFKAGLRPGDTIAMVEAEPVLSRKDLHAALTSDPRPTALTIRRGEKTRKLTIRRAEASR
jgi:S1-C subfamily serine protease